MVIGHARAGPDGPARRDCSAAQWRTDRVRGPWFSATDYGGPRRHFLAIFAMPSVRVRRSSQYASLLGDEAQGQNEQPASRPRSRTLASIYRPSSIPHSLNRGHSQSPHRHDSTGGSGSGSDAAGPSTSHAVQEVRPTSSVTQGRVADHILQKSRSSRMLASHSSRDYLRVDERRMHSMSESQGPRRVTLEGSQVDLSVPKDAGPGLIESNLSLHSTRSNPFRSDDDPLNHDDDIVEHLDVIDPEISTISNLANAANAILIPPIGVYSRKPVVFLPRMTPSDAEKKTLHEDDLDRHVEEVLGKRQKIRRTLRGVWSFIKTPLGVVAAIYGFLVVFWGAAIVIFLVKIINFHNALTQGFWVEVSSQIENALFTVTGIGLIPWRVVDTYRILRVRRFKSLTRKLRAEAGLPELFDEDDLPDPMYDPNYVHVLTEKQEKELHHQQKQFAKSQTWYRPHGTPTHRAFPIDTAMLICICNDGNSIFQIILCGTMWGLNRFERPAWSTGTLIPLSFLCGIASAIFIWKGGQKTKRTKEVEERLRLALKIEHNPEDFRIVDADTRTIHEDIEQEREGRISLDPSSSNRTFQNGCSSDGKKDEDKASEQDGESSRSALIDEKMVIPSNAGRC